MAAGRKSPNVNFKKVKDWVKRYQGTKRKAEFSIINKKIFIKIYKVLKKARKVFIEINHQASGGGSSKQCIA